jgi:uncharacterized protein YbjT (DUF2867 family)
LVHVKYVIHALDSWQAFRNLWTVAADNRRRRVEQENVMYAVAGVSGNTGAAVARALQAAGEPVRVIVRRAEAGEAWQTRGAEVAVANLADRVALTAALRGTKGAYLLNPPRYDVADPFTEADKVGAAFAYAIDASGTGRAVLLSSVGGHLTAGTGIIGTTHRVEEALAEVKTPVAILRARYFFENWAHVLGAARGNGVLPSFLAPADHRVPMVLVADIAATVVELLRGTPWTGRKVIELASFEASPQEVAAAIGTALDKPVAPVVAPHEQWAEILRGNGFSPEVAAAFVAMYDGINMGIVSPQSGMERRQGKSSLAQAARSLVQAS